MNANRPQMAPVIKKKKVKNTIKILFNKWGNALKKKAYSVSAPWTLETNHPYPRTPCSPAGGTQAGSWPTHECSSCTVCRNGTAPQAPDLMNTTRLNFLFFQKPSWWVRRCQHVHLGKHTQSRVASLIQFKPYNEFPITSKMGRQ